MIPNDTAECIVFKNKMFYNKIGKETRNNFFFFIKSSFQKASSEMAVLFSCLNLGRNEVNMAGPKTIYCPRCGHKVSTYDGRTTINVIAKCRKCRKLVIYDIEKDEVRIKELPVRNCSSGMRFY